MAEKYKAKSISDEILLASLYDIVIWTDSYYEIHGTMGIDEFPWLNRTFEMTIFRLGRLQFSMFPSGSDIEEIGIFRGDPALEVHIPRGNHLFYDECKVSFDRAKDFFAKYYPNYPQKWCICHSWLLDEKILPFLGESSNIARFQSFFKLLDKSESDYILRFCFRWDATRENIADFKPTSRFAEKIKQSILAGEKYYEVLGIHKLAE